MAHHYVRYDQIFSSILDSAPNEVGIEGHLFWQVSVVKMK